MEGGQKISINLEAPLDTKSSDMLVSVNDVKFAHNRQKFQGHVLPTSLRYERNGWAAGWYVYDFKMGGGYIFSENDNTLRSQKTWLAAKRSKINNTPTYCLSINTAFGKDTRAEIKQYADAVKTEQFKVWFTDNASINARECKEATITGDPSPRLHFNYALEGVNYIRDFVYTQDVIADTHTFTRQSGSSADLALAFQNIEPDGTVAALLTNNDVKWNWSTDLYVPKDLTDSEGNVFAKFKSITQLVNRHVQWELGNDILLYNDVSGKFIYNSISYNPDSDINISYSIPFSYSVPFVKYYSMLSNISWAIQGTNKLFNNLDDTAQNKYSIDTSMTDTMSISYIGTLATTGINGPDVSLISKAEFDLSSVIDRRLFVRYNTTLADDLNVLFQNVQCTLPVMTFSVPGFKLPNSSEEHDVTVQLYVKYDGEERINAQPINNIPIEAYPINYPSANMWQGEDDLKEPMYVGGFWLTNAMPDPVRESCVVDGKQVAANQSYIDIASDNQSDALRVASRNIVGRLTQFQAKLSAINGVNFGQEVTFNTYGINTNLAFCNHRTGYAWNQGGVYGGHSAALHSGEDVLSQVEGITLYEDLSISQNIYGGGSSDSYYFDITVEDGYERGATVGDSYHYPQNKTTIQYLGTITLNGVEYIYFRNTHRDWGFDNWNTWGYKLVRKNQLYISSVYRESHTDDVGHTSYYYWAILSAGSGSAQSNTGNASAQITQFIDNIGAIPTDLNGGTVTYGAGVVRNGKLINVSDGSVLFGDGNSLGVIPGSGYTGTIIGFNNDTINGQAQLQTSTGVWTYDYRVMDFWINTQSGSAVIDSAAKFCMDIMDNDTGELLVDHDIDTVDFSEFSLSVGLDDDDVFTGELFFNDNIKTFTTPLTDDQVSRIYKFGAKALAFFPIQKDKHTSTRSVYKYSANDVYGTCQGIAVFSTQGRSQADNIPSKYLMSMLSPLSCYVIPPAVEKDKLCVYAKKTFTHKIKVAGNNYTDITVGNNVSRFLSDNSTDMSGVTISPRDNLYNASSEFLETGNKYYDAGTFIDIASISYYNNQMHLTYKAKSGNNMSIDESTYSLSNSEMAIQQTADLRVLYLPKYLNSAKHNFAAGEYNAINLPVIKNILNNIADSNKYWVNVSIAILEPLVDQITLVVTEHLNGQTTDNTILYFSRPTNYIGATANINGDYSTDDQLVIDDNITGTTPVHVPAMPAVGAFAHLIDTNGIATVKQNSNNYFKYDYNSNKVTDMVIKGSHIAVGECQLVEVTDTVAYRKLSLAVDQGVNTLVYFKKYGIYKFDTNNVTGITPRVNSIAYNQSNKHRVTFNVSNLIYMGNAEAAAMGTNVSFTLNLNHFDDKTECTPKYLDYSATDIRDDNPDTQTKQFARVMADNEYQLIKQHWDSTVATECFWWIDPTHTLELTKDRFILKEKIPEGAYDDWMGDKWRVVYELPRTDYLNSEADTFICSSATGKNARGYLYTLQPHTENSILVKVLDPLNQLSEVLVRTITFEHVALGNVLNAVNSVSNDINVGTYSDIVSSSLLADSKLSAVCINGVHWLGIQYDKNFNQWSFAFGQTNKIIQGYGCIGINGYATGGMLPAKYFDGTGFNDTVYDIKKLEAEADLTVNSLDKFNLFNERVVGDENQQWYVASELKDIVMAVDLVRNTSIVLPITNKYAQVYSSPSYAKYTVHALGIQIKQLMNLFTDESNSIWQEIIKYAMFPLVWYLSPYTNVINYLQQTLGQYAYVHYNSTSIGKQSSKPQTTNTEDNAGLSEDETANHIDALITDDLSFDVVHIPQEQSFKDNAWDNVLGIFASMVVSATDYAMKDLTVNSLQNQSAISDIGKKFSQSFLQNIGSMSVTGFNMQSTKPMLKSEVTAVKTLDMFYSTSAQQNCYAGPGFVNMQFVAQCTAQSVTSVQLEAQQTQVFVLLKQLTTWQGKATIYVLDVLKDFMFKQSDNMAGGPSAGMVVGLGYIGALVLSAVGYALVAAKILVKLGLETVDSMLDSFFPGGIKTNVTAQLSRHNYDIEGKHAYGNKSECFMWPCADAKSKLYTDESVEAVLQDKSWPLEMPKATAGNMQFKPVHSAQPNCFTITPSLLNSNNWEGKVPYSIAMCKGSQKRRALPDSTAFVVGTESFMPTVPFKNENIGEGEPVFTPPPVQDYLIDKNWNLFVTAMAGDALWVSCKDTKLFDGNYSNIVITDSFCGIAAPHVAVEVKREITEEYLRPWAVSPDAIALNITGLNCAYDEVAYHAFDGYGYRITDWLGSSGMNKEHYTLQYCFQINDRFKRSNKLPPNQFMGNFQAVPSMSLDIKDKIFNDIQVTSEERGLRTGVAGENKDTQRYSLPIFTEQVSSLPAIVRALSPYKLAVIDGITSLTTDVRISQSVYKIPDSVDFNINDKLYRMTNEYICSVDHQKGLEVVKYLVPALGLTYLGATPFMAYFYNQATRQYYIYQGGNTLQVMDMLERFRDIKSGTYDFINQEVVMPCLATMTRLDKKVKDDADETDNIVIPVFRHNKVGGELTPPITTIFNTESWYRTVSIPAGLVFQGPNRCIINRFVWSQYMLKDIKANKGKWKKVSREEYHPFREYSQHYESMPARIASDSVKGWTHNPFLLVTAPLGVNEETDCKFEWEITFAWTTEMEQLFEQNEYVTVNVMAETMAPGGKVFSRPTHIFLYKELFARSNNFGYYSFRYQSNNGLGNRERLHIWSDGYIAVSSIQLEYTPKTDKRNEMLVIQEDIKGMREM